MKIRLTEQLLMQYRQAPKPMQKAFDKQLRMLQHDIRHPSLHAKKYDEAAGLWQARITQSWRFHFLIDGDEYIIISLGPHSK